jgi:hypothetical protein
VQRVDQTPSVNESRGVTKISSTIDLNMGADATVVSDLKYMNADADDIFERADDHEASGGRKTGESLMINQILRGDQEEGVLVPPRS